MRLLKLTGTINTHHEGEEVLRKAIESGAFNAAIMSREIVVEVAQSRLKKVRETLHGMHVTDVRIREATSIESTVTHSGHGYDTKKCLKVSLAPATRIAGVKFLSFNFSENFRQESVTDPAILMNNVTGIITNAMKKAGITDVLVILEFRKVPENIDTAVESAVVSALVDADGIMQITV